MDLYSDPSYDSRIVSEMDMAILYEGSRGVMGIVEGNGQGDTSSNPGRDW